MYLRNKCENLSKLNKMVKNGQNSQKCPIGKKILNGQKLSKWSNIVKMVKHCQNDK